MQERHKNRKQYFLEQGVTTKKFVMPYINDVFPLNPNMRVLEVGCGEGGNLAPFVEAGFETIGIDLNEKQINNARAYFSEEMPDKNVRLIYQDIYETDEKELGQFDLIFLRDVIEHIHNQEKFMHFIKRFLKPEGRMFFGFPPWYMPFGGHQQICQNKLLSKAPYYHILPMPIYKGILKMFGESKNTIESLEEIKETGISIERFDRIIKKENFKFDKRTLYFINPNYETKFGLKPRKLFSLVGAIPFFRNFCATCYYCVISQKK